MDSLFRISYKSVERGRNLTADLRATTFGNVMRNVRRQFGESGFTLIELLIVTVLMGIVLAIAIPSFAELIVSTRMTNQANDLMADMLYARSEAGSRGVRVVICPSANLTACSTDVADWKSGRIIYADSNGNSTLDANESLQTKVALSGDSTLTPSGFSSLVIIRFTPFGMLEPLGSSGNFKLCPPNSPDGRQIALVTGGRPVVTRVSTCP